MTFIIKLQIDRLGNKLLKCIKAHFIRISNFEILNLLFSIIQSISKSPVSLVAMLNYDMLISKNLV